MPMLGIDPWVMMVIGQWSLSTFLLYWRKIEQILLGLVGEAFESLASCLFDKFTILLICIWFGDVNSGKLTFRHSHGLTE